MWLTIVAGSTAMPLEGGALIVMHGRSRMTIDHCTPTMPGRSTPSFHRPGRDCLHQALQSAVRCSASRMKDELHPTTVRTVCGGYVRAQVRLTGVNHVKTLEGHNLSTSTCNPGNDLPLYSLLACMAVDFNLGTVNPNKTEVATDRICSTKTAALHTTYHLALPFCLSVRLCCLSYHLCIYRSSSRIAQVFWKLALGEAWSSSFYSLRITLYRRYRVPCMILYSFSLATGEQQ